MSPDTSGSLHHPVINGGLIVRLDAPDLEDYAACYGGAKLVDHLRLIRAASSRAPVRPPREARDGTGGHGSPATHALALADESLLPAGIEDPHRRNALEHAINHLVSDRCRRHRDRLTPMAGIALHTPRESVVQLEFAVKRLGFKAVVIPSQLPFADQTPASERAEDYDPFWTQVVKLGVPVFVEGRLPGLRRPPSIAGEIGSALFLTDAMDRFPQLRVVFLARPLGWARRAYRRLASKRAAGRPDPRWPERFFFGAETLDHRPTGTLPCIYASGCDHVPAAAQSTADDPELQEQLRAFLGGAVYRLCTEANPCFFQGTTVERELRRWRPALLEDPAAAA